MTGEHLELVAQSGTIQLADGCKGLEGCQRKKGLNRCPCAFDFACPLAPNWQEDKLNSMLGWAKSRTEEKQMEKQCGIYALLPKGETGEKEERERG